ncbi:MAG: sensor histidine kinase [Solirubrobacteraceae bacterium]
MSFGSSDDCDRPDHAPAGGRPRAFLSGRPFRHWSGPPRTFAALIWLAFIIFPLVDAFGKHGSVLQRGLIIAGAAVFVASYVAIVLTWRGRPNRLTVPLFIVLLTVASALTVGQSSEWGFLFTYCAACTWLVTSKQVGLYVVALCTVLAAAATAIAGGNGGLVVSFVASTAGIGMLMLLMGDLRMRNQELSEARAELAQMAVARERERFARDLHDLLGHSLSVITLKAELAGRMLNDRPFDAAREISELEQVARTALGEVRDAVSGYRQPTLDRELAGARMALSAAGIEADVHEAHVPLDPPVEAVLAWAVREGATNVIRHSRARHCTLQVTASLSDAGVEVIDDGVGTGAGGGTTNGVDTVIGGARGSTPGVGTETRARAGAVNHLSARGVSRGYGLVAGGASGGHGLVAGGASGGHGLAGLAERARLVNGTLEAGALASGGYRLAVTVPVSHR